MGDASVHAERRSALRYHIATPVRFPGGSGVTRDLSAAGLFFLTEKRFEVGQSVELSITLGHADPQCPMELTCRGRVCRVERREPEMCRGTALGVAVVADSFVFD
jgi:hypothetical protein